MENYESEGDYKWLDEEPVPKKLKPVNQENTVDTQTLQIKSHNPQKSNIPQIIIEEQKDQKISNKTDDKQEEDEEEPMVTKSDVREIIKILQKIASKMEYLEGFKKYPYDEKSREAMEEGRAHIYKYRNYYDVTNTIRTSGPIDPQDFDSPVYNVERIFEILERYADIINISNDGTDTLFVVVSHQGRTVFSKEAVIFPGEVKTYWNVYELRLRSPTRGLPYRVTEYTLMDVSQTSAIPIEKAVLQDVKLPGKEENWLDEDLVPTRFPTTFRVQVSVSISGNFQAAITREGNTQVVTFNATSGPALAADGIYAFELIVHRRDSVNFRFSETGGTIKILRVDEIDAAFA